MVQEITRKGDDMRLASIVIYVFFMSAVASAAHNELPANIIDDDLNVLHDWDSPPLGRLGCRNTQLTDINSHRDIAGDYILDDCIFNLHQASIWTADEPGDKKRLDYIVNQRNELTDTDYDTKYSRSEFSLVNTVKDPELATNPSPPMSNYEKAISWIKNAYRAWIPKGHSGSTRLLLLSFGLVGIIGMRRKFKKP